MSVSAEYRMTFRDGSEVCLTHLIGYDISSIRGGEPRISSYVVTAQHTRHIHLSLRDAQEISVCLDRYLNRKDLDAPMVDRQGSESESGLKEVM